MIHCGDCLDVMKTFPDNHFTNILTDPPYGLGFMGKSWDHSVPGKDFWIEALRICKPGSIMLAFGGTRTYHRLTCAIEEAGWEIRDCLMWIYGSGFPKSHNHFGYEGYGTALKPAYEPIIMAMKPLDGTFAQNAEKWGVAGINIDACRITSQDKVSSANTGISSKRKGWDRPWKYDEEKVLKQQERCKLQIDKSKNLGRWPANTLFDEQAAEMLDEQSGLSKSPKGNIKGTNSKGGILNRSEGSRLSSSGHGDSGGASRFFYCAKTSSSERNAGCEGLPLKEAFKFDGGPKVNQWTLKLESEQKMRNYHPTVKPLKLLEYLLKLITPPQNALVLDPFLGSGSTMLAAKNLGISCEGIEINPEYCEIAKARLL